MRRCLFFFSSRRRHTRLQGDWSSDVCSSDLLPALSACRSTLIRGVCTSAGDVRPSASPASTVAVKSPTVVQDRKSTRLNSSHLVISYAVFCLKKKKKHSKRE